MRIVVGLGLVLAVTSGYGSAVLAQENFGTLKPGQTVRVATTGGSRFETRLGRARDTPAEDLFARLDDTRFNLIVVGQSLPSDVPGDHRDLMLVHSIFDDPENIRELARARIPRPSYYLLRPDGHVGLAGTRLDAAALSRYLTERLALPATGFRSAAKSE